MTLFTNKYNKKKENFIGDIVKKEQDSVKKDDSSLLGRDFNYASAIRTPAELGVTAAPTMTALGNDIAGLIEYTNALVSGQGRAVKRRLGNRYFLKTLAKCKLHGRMVDRYLYIDNVPSGNVAFGGTSLTGGRTNVRGLVPGMMESIGKMDPLALFKAFSEGVPNCVRCPTSICPITEGGMSNKPIAVSEYKQIKRLRESFQNIDLNTHDKKKKETIVENIMDNKISISYSVSLSLLAAYIAYRMISR